MQNRQNNPLLKPLFGWIACVSLIVLFLALFSTEASAQTDSYGLPEKTGYNKDVRTKTWSIYAQGGLSWADGVWYKNKNADKSYSTSPAVGGGVDFTIRPWIRIGAEYMWSRYRREQNITSASVASMPLKAYGNYMMNYHNAKLGVGFNFMELWPKRNSQWFNIWLSTGVGYMMAKGNEYSLFFNNTITQDGVSRPITGNVEINNNSSVTISGNIRTLNEHNSFDKVYVPASIHFEFDASRQFTVGLKGEMNWIMDRGDIAPKNLVFALATVRYNFVKGKARLMKEHFDNTIPAMDARMRDMMRMLENEKERADKAENDRNRLQKENEDLLKRLNECENSKPVIVEKPSHSVQFDNNSSYFSKEESEQLMAFVEKYKGKNLSLVAEASTPGTKEYNQRLSEKRLARVVKALVKAGFEEKDLKPSIAIGAQRGIDSAEARRVTITVE